MNRVHRCVARLWDKVYCRLAPGIPRGEVGHEEPIAYYIFTERNVRADNTLRHHEFLPSKKTSNKSCFRIRGLRPEQVESLGKTKVLPERKNTTELFGHAEWQAGNIYENTQLFFDPNNEPWCRHANIIGWPSEPEGRKDQAKVLAALAEYRAYRKRESGQ